MSKWRATAFRGLKFYLVGAAGIIVQLVTVQVLAGHLGVDYLYATPLGVEIAVLHNFYWHERFTFGDRTGSRRGVWGRLLRFNISTGMVSIFGTTLLMRVFVGRLALPLMLANLLSIAVCSVANFLVSDQVVFRSRATDREA